MDHRRRIRSAAATLALALCATEAGAQQRPVYSSDVDLITLSVAVLDPGGEPITDLQQRDFTILEDGVEKPVAMLLKPGETPLDVAMLIDLSNSMRRRDWRRHTRDFLDALDTGDCVFLLGFSTDVGGSLWGAPDDNIVREAVADAQAYGGTAFYDALLVGITEMERSAGTRTFRGSTRSELNPEMTRRRTLHAAPSTTCPVISGEATPTRRRALIVVSDGVDSASMAELDDVRVASQLAGLPLFPIRIEMDSGGSGRGPGRFMADGDEILRELARITGGRTVPADEIGYTEVVSWLRGSYVVGYYATKGTATSRLQIDRHEIEITVNRASARVLHRPAHYRQAIDSAAARSWAAEARRFLDQDALEPALVALDRAVAADPDYAVAWFQRGLLLAPQGNLQAAWEDALRAVEVGPGVPEHHDLAMLLALDLGRPDVAWQQAIRAAQAGGDLSTHRQRLESAAPAPADLQRQLAAPRIAVARPYVESTNQLMESALGIVTLAVRQQLSESPEASLVTDPTLARYVVTVLGLDLDASPQRLRIRINLTNRAGERLRAETLELTDLDEPAGLREVLEGTIDRTIVAAERER